MWFLDHRGLAMSSQFVRVIRKANGGEEAKEIVFNVGMIWKIEVTYATKQGDRVFGTDLAGGMNDPNALRKYKVFVGSEVVTILSNPDDPVVKVIEDIYNGAIKK